MTLIGSHPLCPLSSNQDGRLRTGDHILRIGSTPTSGLTSDQVVKVLQGCGSHVTMLIARDTRSQTMEAPPPPPPPQSAPVSSLPVQPLEAPPQRRLSRTVSSQSALNGPNRRRRMRRLMGAPCWRRWSLSLPSGCCRQGRRQRRSRRNPDPKTSLIHKPRRKNLMFSFAEQSEKIFKNIRQ